MDVASTFLRALDTRGAVYLPYVLKGNFTHEERAAIEAALQPHVPAQVEAIFNTWLICKFSDEYFFAKRATWDMGIGAPTARAMADKITAYYNREDISVNGTK